MFKHLIFDLDGTILKTAEAISYTLQLTMQHFKLNYDVSLNRTISFLGYGTPYLVKNICNNDDLDYDTIIKYFISRQIECHILKANIYPNLKETLTGIKKLGIKLYVATNKPNEVAQSIIPYFYGKDFFIDIVGQVDGIKKKPDPECINILINKYNLNKEECLYIGDSEVDILTAHNANIKCCLVKYGYGKYNEFNNNLAEFIINTPNELKLILG